MGNHFPVVLAFDPNRFLPSDGFGREKLGVYRERNFGWVGFVLRPITGMADFAKDIFIFLQLTIGSDFANQCRRVVTIVSVDLLEA